MNNRERERYEDARKAYTAFIKLYPFTTEDLNGEEWHAFNKQYQISTYGRIKSFFGKPKILKPMLHTGGYLVVQMSIDGKKCKFYVHRLVAETFIPNPCKLPEVNHRWGMKFDNSVENLCWVTAKENSQHAFDTGLNPQGEDHGNAKLTNEQVIYIRENRDGLSNVMLAKMFGVDKTTIGDVQTGKVYKNVAGKIRVPHPQPPPAPVKKIPDETRRYIRQIYIKGDTQFGAKPLARMFGCDSKTIRTIVHEED